MTKFSNTINIKNKRASFDYEFIEKFQAGMVLTGTEIKSLRMGKAGLTDSYCFFVNRELWVKSIYIGTYDWGTYNNHNDRRDRKLLLTKRELRRLEKSIKDMGLTLIPVRIYTNEKGLAKLEIALARGKKNYDKRESIKERDDKREMDRHMKM